MEKQKGPFDKAQGGQALLIVILAMVVALTVGLSVVSRSITTVRISTAEEESQRAFSAAEAGIEEALKSGLSVAEQTLPNNTKYSANIITPASTTEFLVPSPSLKDEAVQIWLSNYPDYSGWYSANNTIAIGWGNKGDTCPNVAALEIIIIYGTTTNPSVARFPVDPCGVTRGNNFINSGLEGDIRISGKDFEYSHSIINFGSRFQNVKFMRIIPLYNSTVMGIKADSSLPLQGKEIESTGKVSSGGQEIVRKIKVFQAYPSLPSIFDHAIFSGTSL